MKNELTIKLCGEAGQGMQTIGAALCRIFKLAGFSVFANQDYMSRVRGGNNFFQIRISDKPMLTLRGKSDITVALDAPSIALHSAAVTQDGVMVLDREKFGVLEQKGYLFDVPFYRIAKETGASEIFVNSVSCGVLTGMMRIEFGFIEQIMKDIFKDKSEEIIRKNIEAARTGYEFAKNNFKEDRFKLKAAKPKETLIMSGNDAVALGAIRAGCKFYTGYPMTPSTNIMNAVAHYAAKFNIVVEQAEDEIAAINMALGASFAGARSMTASSGGGFSLMVEGLSLAGMTETPVVIVVAQRPGPATGFPTRTEQAELDFLIHAGHGEFARVVYAPGTIEQAFYLTVKAFNVAEKWQVPVLIMTDQHLADSYRNIPMFDLNRAKAERYIISKEESKNITNYRRYQFTGSGVSPRAIPSWIEDVIYVDSDEHNEEGHITESAEIRNKMVEKRLYKKMSGLEREIEPPTAYNIQEAGAVLAGFGSTYGVMREACDELSDKKIGFIHFSQVWPFPTKDTLRVLKDKRKIFTVENNAAGQLAGLLRRETGIVANGSILKFDGRPFDLDYLIEQAKKTIK